MTINYHTLGETAYDDDLYEFIKYVEESGQVELAVYDDGVGNPSVGLGFNLNEDFIRDAVVKEISGLSGTALSNLQSSVADVISNYSGNIATLKSDLNQALVNAGGSGNFEFASEAEVKNTFKVLAETTYDPEVNDPNESVPGEQLPNITLPESSERISLFSLHYNGILDQSNNLKAGMNAGDRDEVWYQIRYESNAGQSSGNGIAKRRYYEADNFNLYDDENNVSEDEATDVLTMYTQNKIKIVGYEITYGAQVANANSDYNTTIVKTLDEALAPAKEAINTAYSLGVDVDDYEFLLATDESGEPTIADAFGDKEPHLNDVIIGATGDFLVSGGEGTDIIIGGSATDDLQTFFGGEGADSSFGADDGEVDIVLGGAGDETLFVGENDQIWGGMGNDTIYALNAEFVVGDIGAGESSGDADTIYAVYNSNAPSGAILFGEGGGNTIVAENTSDETLQIVGGDGDDTIIVTGKNIEIFESGGSDTYIINPGSTNIDFWHNEEDPWENDRFFVGDQEVTGKVYYGNHFVIEDLHEEAPAFQADMGAGYTVYMQAYVYPWGGPWEDFLGWEIIGSNTDFMIHSNFVYESPDGSYPYDSEANLDLWINPFYNDTISSPTADPAVDVLTELKEQTGTTGDDNQQGGSGDDHSFGGGGNDTMGGGGGNDTMNGGSGHNQLTGGTGTDTFIIADNANHTDIITDFAVGTESIDVSRVDSDVVVNAQQADTDTIISLGGGQTLILEGVTASSLTGGDFEGEVSVQTVSNTATSGDDLLGGTSSADSIEGGDGDDTIAGGGGNDTLDGGDDEDTLHGRDGNDHLIGGDNNDTIHGDGGDDSIEGGHGLDELLGGDGNDTIDGGVASDVIYGGEGNDSLEGITGLDLIYGGGGDDYIHGGDASDTLYGGDGNDTIEGSSGEDDIFGEAGDDSILGGSSDDVLFGGDDNDYISAYTGHDVLDGGNGNDTLIAGSGNDTVYGGMGADLLRGDGSNDTFLFTATAESTNAAPDRIIDFAVGGSGADILDFTGLGFTGIQSGAASGTVLGYAYNSGTDKTTLAADIITFADFAILFDGNENLSSATILY